MMTIPHNLDIITSRLGSRRMRDADVDLHTILYRSGRFSCGYTGHGLLSVPTLCQKAQAAPELKMQDSQRQSEMRFLLMLAIGGLVFVGCGTGYGERESGMSLGMGIFLSSLVLGP